MLKLILPSVGEMWINWNSHTLPVGVENDSHTLLVGVENDTTTLETAVSAIVIYAYPMT